MSLPEQICGEIADSLPKYKLLDWVDENKLDTWHLSSNPNAIDYLEEHTEKIVWEQLSANPKAMAILKKHPEQIHLSKFCANQNPEAIEIIQESFEIHKKSGCFLPFPLDWDELIRNPYAVNFCLKNRREPIWFYLVSSSLPEVVNRLEEIIKPHLVDDDLFTCILSANSHPKAIALLKKYPEFIHWTSLSRNPNAMKLLLENPDRIDWYGLSLNTNPEAIKILEGLGYLLKSWGLLSGNPSAMEILKANLDKVFWMGLASNSNPEAMELLITHWERLEQPEFVWKNLSKNPAIFRPVRNEAVYRLLIAL